MFPQPLTSSLMKKEPNESLLLTVADRFLILTHPLLSSFHAGTTLLSGTQLTIHHQWITVVAMKKTSHQVLLHRQEVLHHHRQVLPPLHHRQEVLHHRQEVLHHRQVLHNRQVHHPVLRLKKERRNMKCCGCQIVQVRFTLVETEQFAHTRMNNSTCTVFSLDFQ
jgi:hypothetical protein